MRRNINISLILISGLLFGLFQSLNTPFMLIPVLVFNVLCLIFYRSTRLITAFHATNIFLITGFIGRAFILIPDTGAIMLFSAFVDVGSFAIFFVTFGIMLQNQLPRLMERLLMFIAIYYIAFYTSTRFSIIAQLRTLFSPNRQDMLEAVNGFVIVNYVFIGIITLVQAYLIFRFDDIKTREDYRENKRREEIENMFY
ncbi:MAG: hypothetical protein AB7E09_03715 [Candidatus Izemoplasmatales bacterium]|uniref:Uncharacterized protein n=1 Tax=Hujiaoplasma nucleasis TaxID=2725268 RepID=A0A7L6N5Q0_9MOLU|nr:hypothetical protein [Hujiaoplasma nucleasis]QLY40891.1 hypothetical protein HF295_08495 [Hujiaoplasma nucleasis]